MNQARVGLLVAAALVTSAVPATALAQPKGKPAKAAAGKADAKKDQGKTIDLDDTDYSRADDYTRGPDHNSPWRRLKDD